VLARHTGVCGLGEGPPPAREVSEVLGAQDPVTVVIHDGDMPQVYGLHSSPPVRNRGRTRPVTIVLLPASLLTRVLLEPRSRGGSYAKLRHRVKGLERSREGDRLGAGDRSYRFVGWQKPRVV
jgi:hypothetical protein